MPELHAVPLPELLVGIGLKALGDDIADCKCDFVVVTPDLHSTMSEESRIQKQQKPIAGEAVPQMIGETTNGVLEFSPVCSQSIN